MHAGKNNMCNRHSTCLGHLFGRLLFQFFSIQSPYGCGVFAVQLNSGPKFRVQILCPASEVMAVMTTPSPEYSEEDPGLSGLAESFGLWSSQRHGTAGLCLCAAAGRGLTPVGGLGVLRVVA